MFLAETFCHGQHWQTKAFILQEGKESKWQVYYSPGPIVLMLVVLL